MSNNTLPDPQRIGKYELREHLGRGGMAEVWKAYDSQLERYVAIKLLHTDLQNDPDFVTRFIREARVVASLNHPNIVKIHDFQIIQPEESKPPIAYMVMDYIQGITLANYIRTTSRVGKFPSSNEIIQLFTSISKAIDYAHQHGMIHRDIKPGNILLDKRRTDENAIGEPILTDFGIAKLMSASSGTVSGTWLGTPLYISPEQALGQPGNERSDIYSLAIILYEICTGFQPFRGENVPAIMMQHIHMQPPAPALFNTRISPALSMVILRGLAKDPNARFNSASAMVAALAEALGTPGSANVHQSGEISYDPTSPTYLSPVQSYPLPTMTPLVYPAVGTLPFAQPATNSALQGPAQVAQMSGPIPISPATPAVGNPAPSGLTNPMVSLPLVSAPPSGAFPQVMQSPPLPSKRRRPLLIAGVVLLVLLVVGASFGGYYWFSHQTPPVVANPVVGHAFFISSGQTSERGNQGINDELLIDIQNIPDPVPGKAYYAWLLPDTAQRLGSPIFLAKLTPNNGLIHYLYPGDSHHTNLIAVASRFLITEEDAALQPALPSLDKSAWKFYAQLPQTPDSTDMMHEGTLQHLRHLLADAPELLNVNLSGGLDLWLFRNAEKLYQWAASTRDFWETKNAVGVQNAIIRVLDYLDGAKYVQQDVPSGTPNLVNPRIAPLALLEFDQQSQNPPGLLYLIGIHLGALAAAPGISKENHVLASEIQQDNDRVVNWLKQVHAYAQSLIKMSPAQLLAPTTLSSLDSLTTLTRYAFIGQIDPNTNTVLGGVVQIHYNIQRLATFDISAM